ncbi:N-acetylmuramoyl-L-alanine amidase [uncultured Muriicola sp.]|uniref:N-acetylmuramoyl-L-alanine amidase family protein n=1 Tax=uncultured Muriicola sp. TaxID=1583102 RepID=UPI00260AC72C|nr:N-acetylmuramoyl-L-alanine amidase [uncultured Muriicola sp.]
MSRIVCTFLIGLFFTAPTFGQDSLALVVAEKGDGIFSLLRKQGMDPTDHYQDFVVLNKENLREGQHLYEGTVYLLPKVEDAVLSSEIETDLNEVGLSEEEGKRYAIFGDEEALVVNKSDQLSGAIYYLISGHGGPDPGAVETYRDVTIAEDEYAYDVTLRLAKELLAHGAMVYIIVRDENDGIRNKRALEIDRDEVVYPEQEIPLKQLDRLKQRVEAVNELYLENKGSYQRLLVTHVDSRTKGQNIDVFFYHHKKSKNGKRLAENIHNTFLAKYKEYQPNREYTGTFSDRSNLYLVKNTLPAMAYIEIGNLKSKKDQRRILDPDNRQALAKWISEGILADFESR